MEKLACVEKEINDLRSRLIVLEGQQRCLLQKLQEEEKATENKNLFEEYRRISIEITEHLDDIERLKVFEKRNDHPNAILFLGGCSGEWSCANYFQGKLPGFGGFLLIANGKHILIDPGRNTFDELMALNIHPAFIDEVIVTHSHWDCTRDLRQIIMAASRSVLLNQKNWASINQKKNGNLHLWADISALYGLPLAEQKEKIIQFAIETGLYNNNGDIKFLERSLSDFSEIEPASVNIVDLFFRLDGRFKPMFINNEYNLGNNIILKTRKSFHEVTFGIEHIPALDFFIKNKDSSTTRIVYLSDTEYREELAELYRDEKTIDVLICNVKTLETHKYKNKPFTKRHLGWNGAVQFTQDLKSRKLLTNDSSIVLRAWGIETVTDFENIESSDNKKDVQVLLANPDKLRIYQEEFHRVTGMNTIIPGITWLDFVKGKGRTKKVQSVNHVKPPFFPVGYFKTFGTIFYRSDLMEKSIRQARAFAFKPEYNVLIIGERGVGKDELASSMHLVAKRSPEKIAFFNALSFTPEQFRHILTGHIKGSFTGAINNQESWYSTTENGTIIIEEAGNLPKDMQTYLNSPLEKKKYMSFGDNKIKNITTQFIFTTNMDLEQAVKDGLLQQDFLDRFRVIKIPPLRERKEDIYPLIEGWRNHNYHDLKKMPALSKAQLELLQNYDWPGNVRQLLTVMKDITEDKNITSEKIEEIIQKSDEETRRNLTIDDNKLEIILDEMERKIMQLFEARNEALSLSNIQIDLKENGKMPNKSTVNKHLNRLKDANMIEQIGKARNTKYIRL